jgi:hypothetical protein
MNLNRIALTVLLACAGCAASSPYRIPAPATGQFPDEGLITQRAVLTALGRQFSLNGYLTRSANGGQRLVITENFGSVLADVLVKPDGTIHVMRSSRALTPSRIRHFVALDLQCIFGNAPREDCPGQRLSDTHYLVERSWYKLDLHIVETRPGPQSPEMFDESRKPKAKP